MRHILIITMLLTCEAAAGQTALEDYRRSVAEYSWTLKSYSEAVDSAGQAKDKARTGFLPSLSMNGRFSVQFRDTPGVRPWDFALEPQVIQTIYGGGSVRAAYESATLDYDIAVCDEEFAMFDVRYAADYAYWTLSAMSQYLESRHRYVDIIRSLKELVDRRFAEGYIARGDVLQIESRLSEAEYELSVAEQNHAVALHNFNILRGTPFEQEVELAQTILDSIPMPSRSSVDVIIACRPDYAAALLRTDRAQTAVQAARAAYNPQLSIGVGGSWAPYTPNRTGETVINGSAFVQLSVPIFHWGERHRSVGVARAAQKRSELALAQLHDDIMREEMNGWVTLVDSRAQVEASLRSLRIAGENLSISTYSYGEGVATVLDVLQAQLSWLQLYTNAITAQYNYAVAVSAYERIAAR